MTRDNRSANEDAELHRRAEELLRAKIPGLLPLRVLDETQRLIYELAARQVELKLQNEELLKTRDEMAVALGECGEINKDKTLLRCLIDSVGDLIFIKDMKGAYQACNKAAEEFIGLPERDQIGKTDFDFFNRKMAEAIRECDRQVMESGKERRLEEWIPSRLGGKRLFDTVKAPFYSQDGKQLGVVGIARDITDRRQAEERLLRNERQLAEAQRLAHFGSWEWDAIADEIVESDEIKQIFGRYLSSYDGFLELVHAEDREMVNNAVQETIVHQSPYDVHYRIIRTDGATRIIHAQGAAVSDEAGKTVRMIGTAQDVTERREMEDALISLHSEIAARAADLETANSDLEAFNAAVSHDLSAPLAKINAICQILLDFHAHGDDKAGKEYLQEIYSSTMQMNNLINTFLNFSRSSHGDIVNQAVELSNMAIRIAEELEKASPGRKCTFRIAEGVTAYGDPELLRVVMDNLLGNAWKYSAEKEDAVIEFGVIGDEGKQVYFVRDNGVGFDMAQSDIIFAPFHRLLNREGFTGHGLGLATAQRIISRHNGRIWAESEPGNGATFYFTL